MLQNMITIMTVLQKWLRGFSDKKLSTAFVVLPALSSINILTFLIFMIKSKLRNGFFAE